MALKKFYKSLFLFTIIVALFDTTVHSQCNNIVYLSPGDNIQEALDAVGDGGDAPAGRVA